MSKTILSLKTLEKLKMFASTEPTRYYLNGLYFHYRKDRKDFVIVATNGQFAVVFKSKQKWDGKAFDSFILPSEDILPMSAFDKDRSTNIHVAIDTEKKRIAYLEQASIPVGSIDADAIFEKGLAKTFKPIDGTYPDYARVFPAQEDLTGGPLVAFNAEYMSKIASVSENHHTTFLINKDKNGPSVAFVKTLNEDEYVFALMPLREQAIKQYPEWFVRSETEKTKKP